MAAARGIAAIVADAELREDYIIPSVFNRDVADSVAAAVAAEAKRQGAAEARRGRDRLRARGRREAPRRTMTAAAEADDRTDEACMRVTVTGATGLIGSRLVRRAARARRRGDRAQPRPRQAREALGGVEAHAWDPAPGRRPPRRSTAATPSSTWPARTSPSAGATTPSARIRDSREQGTRNLVDGPRGRRAAPARARQLLRGRLLRPARRRGAARGHPGRQRLPGPVCVVWEREARGGRALGLRVVRVRTGVVLDKGGGALAKMLPFFKLGVGGPVAGGRQHMPWVHADDVVGIYLRALDDERWAGAGQRDRAGAGHQQGVLARRSAARCTGRRFAPVPAFAIQAPLRRHGRDRHQGPERRPAARRWSSATAIAHPDLDRRCASALGRD